MAAVVRGGPTSRPKPRAKAQAAPKSRASKSAGYAPAKLGAGHRGLTNRSQRDCASGSAAQESRKVVDANFTANGHHRPNSDERNSL